MIHANAARAACLLVLVTAQSGAAARQDKTGPAAAGFDGNRLRVVDSLVEAAIAERQLPGAVVLVGRGDREVLLRAYGNRAVAPAREAMTTDTIFDLASLTKAVVTATSVMMLVEQGRLRLTDRVSTYIPEFARYGKEDITIRHLLTHVAGLRPDLDLTLEWQGYDRAITLAAEEVPTAPAGERFIYSDIGFFLLGDIIRRVSGTPLDVFARQHLLDPLGMKDTMFLPPERLRSRIAPTERCAPLAWPCNTPDAPILRGIVHDPTARRMGGVAGHAGLFGTASDMARFCRMLLRGGDLQGARVLAPPTIARMTAPASPSDHRDQRGLGWDIDSSFSSPRGDLLPIGSFGHTGFTGTSIWIDPISQIFIVFLSNRVHPDGGGNVTPLRAKLANAVAGALVEAPPLVTLRQPRRSGADAGAAGRASSPPVSRVLAGIDVLRADGFAQLRGTRVALLSNLSARAADGTSTFDVLRTAPDVTLVSVFSPEHGFTAAVDTEVRSSSDERTGVTIHSLYGSTERPTPAMLEGVDTIAVDLPDVGARFYTYTTSMAYVMEEAAKRKVPVVVLDRPNPINGYDIEGPGLDAGISHFAAYFSMPIRHGLTLGELARAFNAEKRIGAELTVVEARGWTRGRWFDETGLSWSNPSPNMRNLHQATLYPGIGAIEWTNISVGRGTDRPFEQIGAPWIDGPALAAALNDRRVPGIRFYPVRFTPVSSAYANEQCAGVFMVITDRSALRPVRVGIEIAAALQKLHPDRFELKSTVRLLGSQATIDGIRRGDDPVAIAESWAATEARWRLLRAKYLIYR